MSKRYLKPRSNRGQSLVEYLVLTCLVAVAAISVVATVGRNIQEHYANVSSALTRGEGKSVTHSAVDARTLGARGFHNYMENAGAHADSK